MKCNVDTAFEYGDFSVLECYVVYTVMYGATFRRTILSPSSEQKAEISSEKSLQIHKLTPYHILEQSNIKCYIAAKHKIINVMWDIM